MMQHWPLPYILIVASPCLFSFLIAGAVLLLRSRPRKRHLGPGHELSYRQVNPHVSLKTGIERADTVKSYHPYVKR